MPTFYLTACFIHEKLEIPVNLISRNEKETNCRRLLFIHEERILINLEKLRAVTSFIQICQKERAI